MTTTRTNGIRKIIKTAKKIPKAHYDDEVLRMLCLTLKRFERLLFLRLCVGVLVGVGSSLGSGLSCNGRTCEWVSKLTDAVHEDTQHSQPLLPTPPTDTRRNTCTIISFHGYIILWFDHDGHVCGHLNSWISNNMQYNKNE